jgi:signal transduction histidine kinase
MGSLSATSLKAEGGATGPRLPRPNRRLLTAAGFCAAGLVLLLVGGVSYHSAWTAHERALSVAHTQKVLHGIQELLGLLTDAETAQRGFLLTGREDYLEPYERARRLYPPALRDLRALTADNPRQQAHIERFRRLADEKMALLSRSPDLRADAERLRVSIEGGAGKLLMDQLRAEAEAMNGIERDLLGQRDRESEESAALTRGVILCGFTLSLALILLSYLLLRRESGERANAQAQAHALNASLERHARELEISNRELEGFSYSVSHDLRIPLRAISGYAQMLEEDAGASLDSEGRRMLGMVRSNAANMNALIDDLLTFSRLGNKALRKVPFDVNRLVAAVVEQCTGPGAAEHAGAAPPRAGAGALPEILVLPLPPAPGDPALLRQAWTNLLSNALKYSASRRPPRIEVGGSVQGGEVVYHVRDNGVGFDMAHAAKLFGVFQRLHGADEYPGTGVGLAIVQRIVSRHGGRVWAQARPDEGATFSFALPLDRKGKETEDDGSHGTD